MPNSSDPYRTDEDATLRSNDRLTPQQRQFAISLGVILAEQWALEYTPIRGDDVASSRNRKNPLKSRDSDEL